MELEFPGLKTFVKFFAFLVVSWLLIHVLSILGVFLAVAFIFWWLLAPSKITCFLCRVRKDGEICPFCKQEVRKATGVSPRSFRSAFLNAFLIFIFSLVSLGLVFVESRVLIKMGFPPTERTVSFHIPSKGQHRLGEIFPMKIEISGIERPINAVQADIGFDPEILEIVDVSIKESFATIFIQKEIDNETGFARLSGGLPNPGSSIGGTFAKVFFKGENPGVVRVEFLPSSMVLANDGRGSNVLKDLASASYMILPEEISDQEKESQSVLIGPEVLGEKASGDKMVFFEEGKVLGEETQTGSREKGVWSNILRIFLNAAEKIDNFVLSFWGKMI